ncbi:hypothetical protein [Defluviimonas salinarum]|uniref:MASE1 domain-containing protein n=1 Tax=Defluviimonas salinarum TaxID=2992147 RepID=A0ABT3J8V6_9RHOB|nr:hypothetical protein [Defluviimonas salinarum]MCW3783865.1 hypothetical protein [Defluviimonas salinarum]
MAYVLAHGLTALLITPLQARLFPDITAFASLVYLPHGVRVLAIWLLKRGALLPLCLGAFLSELLFTPADVSLATDPVILASIAVGAASALLAFELMRGLGHDLYARPTFHVRWQWLLLAGAIASVINSIGQTVVFSGSIQPGDAAAVITTYAIGDLLGLIVSTLVLMFVFRWMRISSGGV